MTSSQLDQLNSTNGSALIHQCPPDQLLRGEATFLAVWWLLAILLVAVTFDFLRRVSRRRREARRVI